MMKRALPLMGLMLALLAGRASVAQTTANDAEVLGIWGSLMVANEMLNSAEATYATLGVSGFEASVGGNEALDTNTDDAQPTLDSNDPLSDLMGSYNDRSGDRSGYSSGNNLDDLTTGDDLVQGSPVE